MPQPRVEPTCPQQRKATTSRKILTTQTSQPLSFSCSYLCSFFMINIDVLIKDNLENTQIAVIKACVRQWEKTIYNTLYIYIHIPTILIQDPSLAHLTPPAPRFWVSSPEIRPAQKRISTRNKYTMKSTINFLHDVEQNTIIYYKHLQRSIYIYNLKSIINFWHDVEQNTCISQTTTW